MLQKELREAAEKLQINTTENANRRKRFRLPGKEKTGPKKHFKSESSQNEGVEERKKKDVSNILRTGLN